MDEHASSALYRRVVSTVGVRLGWPPAPDKEVWEYVTQGGLRRPEVGHLPAPATTGTAAVPSVGL